MSGVEECYRGSRVRVFRLDRDRVIAALRRRAERLVAERPEVLEVRLSGWLAHDRAVPGSDADILVLVRDGAPAFLDCAPALTPYFTGAGIGCDLSVYEEQEAACATSGARSSPRPSRKASRRPRGERIANDRARPRPWPRRIIRDVSHVEHRADAPRSVRCFVLTISDTRTEATDASGRAIADLLAAAGHVVTARRIVRDDPDEVTLQLVKELQGGDAQVIVTTGGTGITSRDSTYEAVADLLEKRLDGFGELFR
ncbi:MAG TPA: molybdopterin-binding protein, partial [Vicinamibacterales bacterium]|nr:molybdopterin-binding protein [Vicinamibacterales bacterium]